MLRIAYFPVINIITQKFSFHSFCLKEKGLVFFHSLLCVYNRHLVIPLLSLFLHFEEPMGQSGRGEASRYRWYWKCENSNFLLFPFYYIMGMGTKPLNMYEIFNVKLPTFCVCRIKTVFQSIDRLYAFITLTSVYKPSRRNKRTLLKVVWLEE